METMGTEPTARRAPAPQPPAAGLTAAWSHAHAQTAPALPRLEPTPQAPQVCQHAARVDMVPLPVVDGLIHWGQDMFTLPIGGISIFVHFRNSPTLNALSLEVPASKAARDFNFIRDFLPMQRLMNALDLAGTMLFSARLPRIESMKETIGRIVAFAHQRRGGDGSGGCRGVKRRRKRCGVGGTL